MRRHVPACLRGPIHFGGVCLRRHAVRGACVPLAACQIGAVWCSCFGAGATQGSSLKPPVAHVQSLVPLEQCSSWQGCWSWQVAGILLSSFALTTAGHLYCSRRKPVSSDARLSHLAGLCGTQVEADLRLNMIRLQVVPAQAHAASSASSALLLPHAVSLGCQQRLCLINPHLFITRATGRGGDAARTR